MRRTTTAFPLLLLTLLFAAGTASAGPAAPPASPPAATPLTLDDLLAPAPATPLAPPAFELKDSCIIYGFCQACTDNRARPCRRTFCNGTTTTRCGTCQVDCVPPPD